MEKDDLTRRRLGIPPRHSAPYFQRRSSSSLPLQFQSFQYANSQTHCTTRASVFGSRWSSGSSSSALRPPMTGGAGAGVQGGFSAGYQVPAASATPLLGLGGVDGRGGSSSHQSKSFFSQPPSNSHTGLVAPTYTPPAQPSLLASKAVAAHDGFPPASTTLSGSMHQQYNMLSFVGQQASSSSCPPIPPLSSLLNQKISSAYGLPPDMPPETGSMTEQHGLAPLPPTLADLDMSMYYNNTGPDSIFPKNMMNDLKSMCGSPGDQPSDVVNGVTVKEEPNENFYSTDNFTPVNSNQMLESKLKQPMAASSHDSWLASGAGASSSRPRSRRPRYNDLAVNPLVVDFANGTFTEGEMKMILADKRLSAEVLTNPKYVRRYGRSTSLRRQILDGRRVSESSRDRKRMYMFDLENKVGLLEKETVLLSTQAHSFQRRVHELTIENNELKDRLKRLEEESNLRLELNNFLRAQIQQLQLNAGKKMDVPNGFSQGMTSSQIIEPGQLEMQDLPSAVSQQAQDVETQLNNGALMSILRRMERDNNGM